MLTVQTRHFNTGLKENGLSSLIWSISSGFNPFEQFISYPQSIFYYFSKQSATAPKCSHLFDFYLVGTSTASSVRFSLADVQPWTKYLGQNLVLMCNSALWKSSISISQDVFTSIDKIFILGGRTFEFVFYIS